MCSMDYSLYSNDQVRVFKTSLSKRVRFIFFLSEATSSYSMGRVAVLRGVETNNLGHCDQKTHITVSREVMSVNSEGHSPHEIITVLMES